MSTMTSEREAFEAMVRKWPNYSDRTLNRDGRAPDYYGNPVVQGAWEGWKARAHLAQPAQAVDVGAIREVIAEMRAFRYATPPNWDHLDNFADELTRAIASPAPDKEGQS